MPACRPVPRTGDASGPVLFLLVLLIFCLLWSLVCGHWTPVLPLCALDGWVFQSRGPAQPARLRSDAINIAHLPCFAVAGPCAAPRLCFACSVVAPSPIAKCLMRFFCCTRPPRNHRTVRMRYVGLLSHCFSLRNFLLPFTKHRLPQVPFFHFGLVKEQRRAPLSEHVNCIKSREDVLDPWPRRRGTPLLGSACIGRQSAWDFRCRAQV
ncbi:hypothetical protein EXIGLDRAFT_175126 [Exidia glandulosa HHB12029]|uniref:Uncharacterized protein n=1 Tax=Exidia glandulosa HHB12029 TaxID=1314781 RepID=A0A165F711_EXIGL|nr:hypothetical protein EXIGLDRAFT_175126 [Exidia glandulosa HHB12029]